MSEVLHPRFVRHEECAIVGVHFHDFLGGDFVDFQLAFPVDAKKESLVGIPADFALQDFEKLLDDILVLQSLVTTI